MLYKRDCNLSVGCVFDKYGLSQNGYGGAGKHWGRWDKGAEEGMNEKTKQEESRKTDALEALSHSFLISSLTQCLVWADFR